jgi:hypothetical protein
MMFTMKNIRKRIAALALAVTATFGGLIVANVADAGTYWTSSNCAHATAGSRICADVSAGTVTVYNNSNVAVAGQTGVAFWGFGSATRGWISYDFECNAGGGNVTAFATPGGYGLPTTVQFNPGSTAAGSVQVDAGMRDTIAWYANSNQGYECIIVP